MIRLILTFLIGLGSVSCATQPLFTNIYCRTFRNSDSVKNEVSSVREIPSESTIAIGTLISKDYTIEVVVYNLTDKTMSIDRTQSFFMTPNYQIAYYDPQVTTHTITNSTGRGANVNLGAVAGTLGVGGVAGAVLSGVNVGRTSSNSDATTTYDIDQPVVHIPPHGHASMGRLFDIKDMIGTKENPSTDSSQCTFGICVAYSTDRLHSVRNFISQYSMSDFISSPIRRSGRKYYINEALRNIYISRPNLFNERSFVLEYDDNNNRNGLLEMPKSAWAKPTMLYDYQ